MTSAASWCPFASLTKADERLMAIGAVRARPGNPMLTRLLLSALLLTACSSKSRSQSECDAIANDIRSALVDAGKSPSTVVCASTDPDTQKQFGAKCQALTDCNNDCCK
jgi:hypothetical protein